MCLGIGYLCLGTYVCFGAGVFCSSVLFPGWSSCGYCAVVGFFDTTFPCRWCCCTVTLFHCFHCPWLVVFVCTGCLFCSIYSEFIIVSCVVLFSCCTRVSLSCLCLLSVWCVSFLLYLTVYCCPYWACPIGSCLLVWGGDNQSTAQNTKEFIRQKSHQRRDLYQRCAQRTYKYLRAIELYLVRQPEDGL